MHRVRIVGCTKPFENTHIFQMSLIPNVTGRRVSFPMGSYGAGSIKMTVFLSCMDGWTRKSDSVSPKTKKNSANLLCAVEALGNTSKVVFIAETHQYQAAQGMPGKDYWVMWDMP